MPTPSDSTDGLLLPSHIEHSLHSSCPPEADRPSEWRAQVLDRLSRAGHQPDTAVASMAVTGADGSSTQPQRLDADGDQSTALVPDAEASSKRPDRAAMVHPDTSTSTSASDSPPSCHTEEKQNEEKEEVQTSTDAPTSSIVDLPYSTRLGLHSSRVCQTKPNTFQLDGRLIWNPVNPNLHLVHASARKQISRYPAIRCFKIQC